MGDRKLATPLGGDLFSVPVDGSTARLVLLGRDLWVLRHRRALPSRLRARLRHPQQFQGALNELATAASFARIGYDVGWIDERRSDRRKPEFIARRGHEFAVEVKSRHRSGVFGSAGTRSPGTDVDAIARDVGALFRDATQKDPGGLPYLIFIDLNSPLELTSATEAPIKNQMGTLATSLAAESGPGAGFNAIVLTNFAIHYGAPRTTPPESWFHVTVMNGKATVADALLEEIFEAVRRYREIPDPDDFTGQGRQPR